MSSGPLLTMWLDLASTVLVAVGVVLQLFDWLAVCQFIVDEVWLSYRLPSGSSAARGGSIGLPPARNSSSTTFAISRTRLHHLEGLTRAYAYACASSRATK